ALVPTGEIAVGEVLGVGNRRVELVVSLDASTLVEPQNAQPPRRGIAARLRRHHPIAFDRAVMAGDSGRSEEMLAAAAPFLPGAGDARLDGVVAARLDQAMTGRAICRPESANALARPPGITLVADFDISLRQRHCVHGSRPSCRSLGLAQEGAADRAAGR